MDTIVAYFLGDQRSGQGSLLATKVVRLYGCFAPDDRIAVDFLFQLSCDSFPRSTPLSRYTRMLEPP